MKKREYLTDDEIYLIWGISDEYAEEVIKNRNGRKIYYESSLTELDNFTIYYEEVSEGRGGRNGSKTVKNAP